MAYTIHDSPRIRARIEQDLEVICSTVRKADPSLISLVLTGGFARGEGAIVDGHPQNDYDLVAIRGLPPPEQPYPQIEAKLAKRLDFHVDLAPVRALRLPFVSSSIFWYETRRRGHVLWGKDLLDRIPVQHADELDREEAMRLLANRAAGLLFATRSHEPHSLRLQAAKGLLAAGDVHLLARGKFPPSQRERWARIEAIHAIGELAPALEKRYPWHAWALEFKVDPEACKPRDPLRAWRKARSAILEAVPVALEHAETASLDAYAASDGLVDHAVFLARSNGLPGGRRLARNPTRRVRVATLRLLEASKQAEIDEEVAKRELGELASTEEDPLATLEALRAATLQ